MVEIKVEFSSKFNSVALSASITYLYAEMRPSRTPLGDLKEAGMQKSPTIRSGMIGVKMCHIRKGEGELYASRLHDHHSFWHTWSLTEPPEFSAAGFPTWDWISFSTGAVESLGVPFHPNSTVPAYL